MSLTLKQRYLNEQKRYAAAITTEPTVAKLAVDVANHAVAINNAMSELDTLTTDLSTHKLDYTEHLNSTMPHKIENLKTGKTYRYGYQMSAEGIRK